MKHLTFLIAIFFAKNVIAQVTLEHTYPDYVGAFGLIAVDSNELKYVQFNNADSIWIYNLDHTLAKVITVPLIPKRNNLELIQISKVLWDKSNTYSYMVSDKEQSALRVFREDGKSLYSCDSCDLHFDQNGLANQRLSPGASIVSTPLGVKMIVVHYETSTWYVTVHGLPGKLTEAQKSRVSIIDNPGSPRSSVTINSIYPNPASSTVSLSYSLDKSEFVRIELFTPTGESAQVISDGFQSQGSHQIQFDAAQLAQGAYYLQVITAAGSASALTEIIR